MTKRDRISKHLNSEVIDRIATLGGWLASAKHLQALSGTTEEDYWKDPEEAVIKAYQALDVDGLIGMFLPPTQDRYRTVTRNTIKERTEKYRSPEDVIEFIDALSSPESLKTGFDGKKYYDETLDERVMLQKRVKDIVWMPAIFSTSCNFMWYSEFGYENYLSALALYPEAIETLFEYSAEEARLKNKIKARIIQEQSFVPFILLGQDLCGTGGPMVSPGFLRDHYFPHVKTAPVPLHDAGINTVWHCNG